MQLSPFLSLATLVLSGVADMAAGTSVHSAATLVGPANAAPAVVGYHVQTKPSPVPSIEHATATCGPGEHLLSGGHVSMGATVLDSFPSTSDGRPVSAGSEVDSWTVVVLVPATARHHTSAAAEVYAACLRGGAAHTRAYSTPQGFGDLLTAAHASC